MARERHKPAEIVAKLGQVEVLTAQGKSASEIYSSFFVRPKDQKTRPFGTLQHMGKYHSTAELREYHT